MYAIIMDTSNQYLTVGLFQDGKLLSKKQVKALRQQSELAIPYLEEILSNFNLELKDVDEMIISIGPGSYTGVRIAMTIAKTLAAVLPIKIKGISSLAMFAGKQKAISIIDARSHKVYVGIYENGKALQEDCLMDLEEFKAFYKQHDDFLLVGDVELLDQPVRQIDVCENLYQLSLNQPYIEDVDALVPTYIKDVEVKAKCSKD